MTTKQPSSGTRWIVSLPYNRIECLYASPYNVAVSCARRRRHPAARVIPRLLATVAVRVAAMCRTIMRVPAVPLDAERLDRHRKRLCLRNAGRGLANGAYQYNRPSIAL